jgi:hypothetical protein
MDGFSLAVRQPCLHILDHLDDPTCRMHNGVPDGCNCQQTGEKHSSRRELHAERSTPEWPVPN